MNKTLVFNGENDQSYGVTCGKDAEDNVSGLGPNPMNGKNEYCGAEVD